MQRFKCNDWCAIRFYNTQIYITRFVELNINHELRTESLLVSDEESRIHLLGQLLAAISNTILTQKDELRNTLQTLVNWSNENKSSLTPLELFERIEQLFNKQSSYAKVSNDILQIVRDRKSDCINMFREALLKQIPDEYHYI